MGNNKNSSSKTNNNDDSSKNSSRAPTQAKPVIEKRSDNDYCASQKDGKVEEERKNTSFKPIMFPALLFLVTVILFASHSVIPHSVSSGRRRGQITTNMFFLQ